MQPSPTHGPSRRGHLPATGPAVEDHGRVVTANTRAAAWYRQAQRAASPHRAAVALRVAISADPGFALAAADLAALTGASGQQPADRAMNWERHHIEVVATAAAGQATRAADLLREHLASVGCDPLAIRITVHITGRLQPPTGPGDHFEDLAGQLPGCHASPWPMTAGSGGDEVFGGLAADVEVPVEACDVVGFLKWSAFGGAWRAGDPCADRDMAGVDTAADECTVEGEGPFA